MLILNDYSRNPGPYQVAGNTPAYLSDNISALLYRLALDGWADQDAGDAQEIGLWAALFDGPIQDAENTATEYNIALTYQDAECIKNAIGFILTKNDRGDVDYTLYTDPALLAEHWRLTVDDIEHGYQH